MRFLLLAPTKMASRSELAPPSEVPGRGPMMRSRFDFDAAELRQHWTDLPATDVVTPGGAEPALIRTAGLCRLRGIGVLVLEVDIGFTIHSTDLEQMESQLTQVAEIYAGQYLAGNERDLAWVGRTHLLDAKETGVPRWLAEKTDTAPLSDVHQTGHVTATASWGNGEISGYRQLGDDAWRETVRGMIDAQVLWREISMIAERAAQRARSRLVGKHSSRSQLRRFLNDIEELTVFAADHNLAADEQMLAVQGNRKSAGDAWLRVWGYSDMVSRVERRLQDLEAVAERRTARINARYQGSVEVILLILGALTLFDLAFSAVSASFIGVTEHVPGAYVPFSLFQAVRFVGGDFVLLLAAVLMLGGVLWLWRTRKVK